MEVGKGDVKQKTIDTIRILCAEAITKAKSGHPGICFDAAPIGFVLYDDILKYSVRNPHWENRDRFVLSAGHGSMLQYALLHLFGDDVKKEDLMNFRQFGSITPGHPEHNVTKGVNCSTGPLGQGIANAVGLALAETHLASLFNKPEYPVVDHYTYVLCGEGCLEEGIGYEACSFAGTQKLGKLILFYDCNKISIEGNTDDAFADDIKLRFKSQHWQVLEVDDANDINSLKAAVNEAKAETEKPSIIICHSVIGYGTPVAGTAAAHGTPLSEEQLKKTKEYYNWTEDSFEVPLEVKKYCNTVKEQKNLSEDTWQKMFDEYCKKYPELAKTYKQYFEQSVPDLNTLYEKLFTEKAEASRISGGIVINEIAKAVPNLLSGSADLSPSTKTDLTGEGWYSPQNRAGRNIHFGIREHAMGAICNGIALHGGLKVICSTFFVFSDYMKAAMRMSAIMELPVIYVLTHDSIGVGEDGPTHQPIEQLAMLRATPDTLVFRPADRSETISAFLTALKVKTPCAIALSRQNLTQYNSGNKSIHGAYVLGGCEKPRVTLLSTGSEVQLCMQAKALLEQNKISAQVVSMPCNEVFEKKDENYKKTVLPDIPTLCVEASSDNLWYKYGDGIIRMESFGLSGNTETLYNHFGFTVEKIAECAKKLI